ncbi:protein phosphatase 5 [Cantharellus anzutake]|uniref:protein phosphatase 5 n=1 Tax=Cantharellus anzutake TaxID=1750568 RepID=UPI00190456D1|nr:protein phosphatase 5 [Cantharellus anzutake]KAF8326704.1 protein phosphatase 5 [Cantharellus anzutake]
MKLEEHGFAIEDATRAIEIDPGYVKAYYRRALCQLAVLRPQFAIPDFKKCLALDPHNKLAKTQLDATTKLLKRMQFEAAITVGEEKSAVDRCREIIADGGCDHTEPSYSGPLLPIITPATKGSQPKYGINKEFVEGMLKWFKEGKTLPRRFVWEIVLNTYDILMKEESLIDIPLEEGVICDVIGDTHGALTGLPSESHCLLFNGDFVDRGSWSVEVVTTLFAYKWLYPNRVGLNRGNHETKDMNKVYGFEGEVRHKHGEQTYKVRLMVLALVPLATMVSPRLPPKTSHDAAHGSPILSPEGRKRFFVVHGGLFSKDGITLDEVRKIDRLGKQPGNEGLMCELLWTDPQETNGRGPSKRGVGLGFGPDITKAWCELNSVTGVIRSHEVRQGGYAIEHGGLCITVFSAPNYVDQGQNLGAYLRIDAAGERSYHTFKASPHPPLRPMAYSNPGLAMFG